LSHVDEQGGIMGIAQSMPSLGRILGPIWGGYSFGAIGLRWPFLSAALCTTVAFLIGLKNLTAKSL
jgi:MFS family permease